MSSSGVFSYQTRSAGKKYVKKLRHQGMVPAVLNNTKAECVNVALSSFDVEEIYNTGYISSSVLTLENDGQRKQVVVTDYELHPVTERVLHLDLKEISQSDTVKAKVVVRYKNKLLSTGIKRGGSLNKIKRFISVSAKPEDLPKEVIVDLAKLNVGDSVRIADLEIGNKVRVLEEPESVIVAIKGSKGAKSTTTTDGSDTA